MSETPSGRSRGNDRGGEPEAAGPDTTADLAARLRAVERALTDGEVPPADLSDAAAREERLDRLAARVEDLEGRLARAEAGVEAVRGYVGSVRAVNREVERRADAALAATEDGGTRRSPPADLDLSGDDGTTPGEEGSVRERLEQLL